MTDTTELVLSGNGIAPYSARALTQSIAPIDAAANMRRTVNGALVDVSAPQFRKYKSTISCADMQDPALDGVWPGMVLTVDSVSRLAYPEGGAPARLVVPGSEFTDSGFTFYRLRMTCRVMNFNAERNEYGAVTSWSLDLEEV